MICDPIQCRKGYLYKQSGGSGSSTTVLKFGVETPGFCLLGTAKHTECRADRPHVYIHTNIV